MSARCTLADWCKRPAGHRGKCSKKVSRKELEQLLRAGLMTDAEKKLWKQITGEDI